MMDDEELMADLRRICAQSDPVPEFVVDNARDALLTRRFDEELAELLLDSAAESGLLRGEQERVRLLSFQLTDLSLEVRVEYLGEQASVRGFVEGMTGQVEVDLGSEHRTVPIDADGEFTTEVPRGAVRFRLRAHDGVIVTTRWVLL
jgi:hypothetical protein